MQAITLTDVPQFFNIYGICGICGTLTGMTSRRDWARAAALLLPLVLVNTAAIYGQAGWAYDHLIHQWAIAALFAAAVESIGIYLAFEAHSALMAGDASARLRGGSYLIGLLAGALNYAHFAATGYAPTPLAVTFAALSSISPWLWAIRSRSMNRARLRELGQVDPRAVRFSLLRWLLFPVRTVKAFRVAVWHGIVSPSVAVARSGVKAPGLAASAVAELVDEHPADGPVEAPVIAWFGQPHESANGVALPRPLPQVHRAPIMAAPYANRPVSAPPVDSRRGGPTVADQVRRTAAVLERRGVELSAAEVAEIVGTPNTWHVTRVLKKATKPSVDEDATTDDTREMEDATT